LRGLKDTTGLGWRFGDKFPMQWAMAFVVAVILYLSNGAHIALRWWGGEVNLGLWAIPLGTFLLVASSNAVNLADGVDGLAGGISAIAYLALGALALLLNHDPVGLFGFIMAGALCAFLWYNVHPARMFMGDVGAEALGAGLAAMALLSGQVLLLPVVGALLVAEALSD
ncbi:MAG: phospho-N-acetylmuramoyl-pentapeptide-transferase, partial [Chloroflexi bacterium]|nr:phospho-N-acetylmuramoyl-pentapeptide-transferase [Chloroflexota bacterium]